jgi:phosphotransferase system enzyme I (PtsI)
VLRASVNKNIWFMLPMVSSISEIRDSKTIIDSCKEELRNAGVPFDEEMKVGIMVEVPSAAVMAKEFAEEVDFLSIGTNDLIQYILAVDRGNDYVNDQYQEFHPAVIKTLSYIIEEGKKGNVCVSICGEMAADTMATALLVGLGLDSLSVSGSVIPYLKKIVRSLNYEDTRKLAEECLQFKTEKEIHDRLDRFVEENLIEQTEKYLEL